MTMSKLRDLCAFGDVPECAPTERYLGELCVLRAALRWVLSLSLLGASFAGVLAYREYSSAGAAVCAPLGPSGSALGMPSCVYGLALFTTLTIIAAVALVRTRGAVGDEIMDTSR